MRLSELLHSHVVDVDGEHVGAIDDVRLVQDGPLLLPFGAAFRAEGVVVGHRAVGVRLGYHRGKVGGPWLLKALFHRLEQRARWVPWDEVVSWEDDIVRIGVRRDELGAPPEG
jgi:sporulation protein YlmC with PRC-barrel domain